MKIIRRNFLTLKDRTFSFDMTDHLDPQQDQNSILTEICKGIGVAYQEEFPIWARLLPFFSLLDEKSQKAGFNCLIFRKQGQDITVEHFGPFGKKKSEELTDIIRKTSYAFKKLIEKWRELESQDNTKSEEEKKKERDGITQELEMIYWRYVQIIESKIESKKKELIDLIYRVLKDDKATSEYLITAKIRERIILEIGEKTAAKIAAKSGAKVAAKFGAKAGAKTGTKAGGKAIPVAGLVVGLGFAMLKLCKGDLAGAGLEAASGALSCAPVVGTAAAVGIDVGIAGRDIMIAKEEENKRIEEMLMQANNWKTEIERIQADLNDLGMQYDQAKEEFEFVKMFLEDPGFKIEKLEHEISILDDILEKVDKS